MKAMTTFLLIFITALQMAYCQAGIVPNCLASVVNVSNYCQTCINNYISTNYSCCNVSLGGCRSCWNNSNRCDSCLDISYCSENGSCPSCHSMMDFCSTCSSCNTCLTCNSSSYVINSSKCAACSQFISNCFICSSKITCTFCMAGFILSSPNCISCTMYFSNCSSCSQVLVYISYSFSYVKECFACNKGFFQKVMYGLCYFCPQFMQNCTSCTNSGNCLTCQDKLIVFNYNQCVTCNIAIRNCLNCTNATYCTACINTQYTLNFTNSTSSSCVLCMSFMYSCMNCISQTVCTVCASGQVVANGCSSVPGCISVVQIAPRSICSTCDTSNFYPNAINGACLCLKGHLAGLYCTEIIGCVIATNNACLICKKSLHFLLINGNCICLSGYHPSALECSEICGDGKKFELPCDDGNLIDGDGCSSSCEVEPEYNCSGGTKTSPSRCIYQGKVVLQLVCTYKQFGNAAQIHLKIKPYILNMKKSNMSLRFYNYKNSSMTSYQITDETVIVYISYLQNVEASNVLINFFFDPRYVRTPSFSTMFQLIQCDGNQLIYDPNPFKGSQAFFSFLIQILSAIVLVAWILGSYSHKMIGVQTLHTFHLIFIAQAFSENYFPFVAYFQGLNNTLNFYQSKFTSQPYIDYKAYNKLSFSADIIYNGIIITIFQFSSLLLFLIVALLNKMLQSSKKLTGQQQKLTKINRFKNFIYAFLVFPLFIGFFFNFSISLLISSHNSIEKLYKNLELQLIIVLFTMITTAFIFFSEWKQTISLIQINYKENYVRLYLVNMLILSAIIQTSLDSLISLPLLSMMGVVVLYTVALLIYRPYKVCIHNVGLIFNQLGVILYSLWLIAQKYLHFQKKTEQMIVFGLFGWMILILMIAVIRIIFELRKGCSKSQLQKNECNILKKEKFKIGNQMKQQRQDKVNSYLIGSQMMRERQIIEYQYHKQRGLKFQLLNHSIQSSRNNQTDVKEKRNKKVANRPKRIVQDFE